MILIPDDIQTALDNDSALIVSVSGGKDSDCMALEIARLRQQYNWQGRFVLLHCDVGRMEWKQSIHHCEQLAQKLGAEFVVVRHHDKDLIDGIWARYDSRPDAPPFPSNAYRWCTAGWKRNPADKWIRNNCPEGAVCAMGLRREESVSRSKKLPCEVRNGATAPTKNRHVWNWHPILNYRLADVWHTIGYTLHELRSLQVTPEHLDAMGLTLDQYADQVQFKAHPAYLAGNERVSCALCVLASKNDLRNGAIYQPDTYKQLVQIEVATGYTFQQDVSLLHLFDEDNQPKAKQLSLF